MDRRWVMNDADPAAVDHLCRELGIPPPVARVLVNRGVGDVPSARRFLAPTLRDLHPPEGLITMDRATDRILAALDGREPIWVYGDYDADGITSVALLLSFFQSIGIAARPVIPHRERDGYGYRDALIPGGEGSPGGLVVTVDCGVSDAQEIAKTRARGLDVIVTDHHEVPDVLPEACAVINPKRGDNPYPFSDLAGVGVAFLLAWATAKRLRQRGFWTGRQEPSLKDYLDLVAVGTVADQAPLLGENRALVTHGLHQMARNARPGMTALLKVCGVANRAPSVSTLSYQVAPRLNAPGRVDEASPALQLLLTRDGREAEELAGLLDGMNRRRQQIEEQVHREAAEMAWTALRQGHRGLVLAREGWHPGVLGIVASRLVERMSVPVVLVAIQDGVGKGSARSPEGYHLMRGLQACASHLVRYGGHRQAAGLRIHADALPPFQEAFSRNVQAVLGDRPGGAVLRIDDRLDPDQVTRELIRHLDQLAPHGSGNPEPVFQMDPLEVAQCRRVGQDHLKLRVRNGGVGFDAIGFGMGNVHPDPLEGWVQLACVPQLNEWQGRTSIQLKLKDLKRL